MDLREYVHKDRLLAVLRRVVRPGDTPTALVERLKAMKYRVNNALVKYALLVLALEGSIELEIEPKPSGYVYIAVSKVVQRGEEEEQELSE